MRRLGLVAMLSAGLGAGLAAVPATAPARTTATVLSSNWAGYAASGRHFRRVVASWTVAPASCPAGPGSAEVTWVGLGGNSESSTHLEQAGTSIDCTSAGPKYAAWYELVPDVLHTVRLRVRPGNRIAASVTVIGHHVRVVLRNRSTRRNYVRHLVMAHPDTASAEWIAEAPTKCLVGGGCATAALADFGAVNFSFASAQGRRGHKGTISDRFWKATPIALVAQPSDGGTAGGIGASATPGPLRAKGSAFTVTYHDGASAAAASPRHARAFPSSRLR